MLIWRLSVWFHGFIIIFVTIRSRKMMKPTTFTRKGPVDNIGRRGSVNYQADLVSKCVESVLPKCNVSNNFE